VGIDAAPRLTRLSVAEPAKGEVLADCASTCWGYQWCDR
jgi:hypothetical protein